MKPLASRVQRSFYTPLWTFWVSSERVKRRVLRTKAFQSLRGRRQTNFPPLKRPIFIIGTVRSGTTLLAKCLGEHPRIMYVPYELTSEWCNFADIEIARSFNNMANCPPYTEAAVTEVCRNKVREGFAKLFYLNGGNRRIRFLNKNPHLWNKLPFLRSLFPDARLVITSRDIRSTVASMKLLWMELNKRHKKKYYFPEDLDYCWGVIPPARPPATADGRIFPGGDVAVLAEHWLHAYETIKRNLDGFECPVAVKHRNFVADPDQTLAGIFENMGLPRVSYSLPESLDPTRSNRWRDILTVEERNDLDRFIDRNRGRIERLQYTDSTL